MERFDCAQCGIRKGAIRLVIGGHPGLRRPQRLFNAEQRVILYSAVAARNKQKSGLWPDAAGRFQPAPVLKQRAGRPSVESGWKTNFHFSHPQTCKRTGIGVWSIGADTHSFMQRLALIFFLFCLCTQLCAADDHLRRRNGKKRRMETGLIIYSRTRAGSTLKEFKSVGTIDALSSAVFAVLNDVEAYPSFMPYTSECSVLERKGDCTIAYQRLALPLVSDRDYTLRSEHSKTPGPNGPIYHIQWEPGQRPRSSRESRG